MQANKFRQQFGLSESKIWENKASNVLLLRENDITLEFTTMNGSAIVKQADVVLMSFPLGYNDNYTDQNALNDLDYVSTASKLNLVIKILTLLSPCSMRTSSLLTDQP
jgi:hypothetical protein